MKTSLKTLLLFVLLAGALAAIAQGPRADRVESMRVAFLTNYLQLTPEESQRFWPVYNAYRNETKQLRQSFGMTADPESPVSPEREIEFEQKKLDLKKKYLPQFKAAIGPDKSGRLLQAEQEFKRQMLETLRDRRGK